MSADPFSDILKLVNAETAVSGGFTAGGNWAIRFPAEDKIKFCAIVKGNCSASIEGHEETAACRDRRCVSPFGEAFLHTRQ
jgi:Cupin